MQTSIFTKIINGEIPSHKVYEDENTFAFMDIHPVQQGMVLVVPKAEVDNFEDLESDDYLQLMTTVKRVAQGLRRVFPDKAKIGVQIEGLEVPHVHVKLIPIDSGAEFHAHAPETEPDHEALAELAMKIKENIDV